MDVSRTVFEILTHKARKWLVFPTPPLFDAPAQGEPVRISCETYPAKTRGMGLLYSENCMILTSTVFDCSTRVTDKQTDGRTDGIAIAYARLAHMLSRAKIAADLQVTETGQIYYFGLCVNIFLVLWFPLLQFGPLLVRPGLRRIVSLTSLQKYSHGGFLPISKTILVRVTSFSAQDHF